MNDEIKVPKILSKRKHSAILIFCIYSVQLSTSVVIYYLPLITNFYLLWTVVYYALTFFCAIPQAGFSDVFGRKKHLLIACSGVLLSVLCLSIVYLVKKNNLNQSSIMQSFLVILPICFLLGATGNAIPIARAAIADLKIHDFRTAMGWATTIIGFGWITAVILGFILPPLGILISVILLQLTIIFLIKNYFQDTEDNTIKKYSKKPFFNVITSSYGWFGSMFLAAGGASAIFAYLFAETTFYQIYSLNEVSGANLTTKVVGILMAIGYAFGVIMQWIIYFSDKKGIKYGIAISLIMLINILIFKNFIEYNVSVFFTKNSHIIEGVLDFLFAFGFGFSIPALFSLMSKRLEIHHFGKLFGVIDSIDTLALGLSFFILFLGNQLNFINRNIYIFSLLFFLISCIFYLVFIRKFTSYEKENKNKEK
ncbi:MAG: hypothetical protein K1060chlam4_00638 [Candidatus Anoxychlamydiales bacterium]|nr:hypothetical protein [Candidatus Anoxychlamydiales bacterium]